MLQQRLWCKILRQQHSLTEMAIWCQFVILIWSSNLTWFLIEKWLVDKVKANNKYHGQSVKSSTIYYFGGKQEKIYEKKTKTNIPYSVLHV